MDKPQVAPRQRRKDARPGEILEAAFEEFAQKGFAATRVDDVALRAGITKGTVYLYFPSKEDLFVATFKQTLQPTLDHLSKVATDPEGPAMDILRDFFRIVYDVLVQDRHGRELLRMMMAEGGRFPDLTERWHDEIIAPVNNHLAGLVRYGIARGEFRALEGNDLPNLMMAPVVSASTWGSLFGDRHPLDLPSYREAHLDMLARTLVVPGVGDGR